MRRALLYVQIPCAGELGARDKLALRMAEFAGTDRRRCLERIWMRPIALGSSLNGFELHVYSYGPSNRWCHGCRDCLTYAHQQLEDQLAREDHENLCNLAYCYSSKLLYHASGDEKG